MTRPIAIALFVVSGALAAIYGVVVQPDLAAQANARVLGQFMPEAGR